MSAFVVVRCKSITEIREDNEMAQGPVDRSVKVLFRHTQHNGGWRVPGERERGNRSPISSIVPPRSSPLDDVNEG